MNPWQVLEVERSADVRAIKRAYAKKLKVTRPEEKPIEFQELHQAYKMALGFAQRSVAKSEDVGSDLVEANDDSLKSISVENDWISESSDKPLVACSEESAHRENQATLDALEQERLNESFETLVSQVEIMLAEESVSDDVKDWNFLTQSPHLLNDEFNWLLGLAVFRLFANFQGKKVRRARGRYYRRDIPENIVVFCDHIFSWSNRKSYLAENLGYEVCRKLFEQLDDVQFNDSQVNVRGGELIRSPSKSRARAKVEAARMERSSGFNFWLLFILFFGLAKLFGFLASR